MILHELEGAGVEDIARLLGVTRSTVRWHLSLGRRELCRIIKKDDLR
jgi:DNA-directed RNA polymerase specialized sigma24 family protein